MRFKSSGLGDKELKGRMTSLSLVGQDLLVMHIETYEPVQWHLRAGLEVNDVPALIKGLLKPSVLLLVIRTMFWVKKNPREPTDF